MKRLIILLIFSLFIYQPFIAQNKDLEKIRDKYIESLSPEIFNAYKAGERISKQGISLVKNLSSNLEKTTSLIESSDPKLLLDDFNEKIKQINQLEDNFSEQSLNYQVNAFKTIASNIQSNNNLGALGAGIGLLNAYNQRKKAQEKIEAKKEELRKKRHEQMSKIYWKAIDFNAITKQKYIHNAAYSRSLDEESINLAYVKNLDCFNKAMKDNFSSENSNWLINNCSKPNNSFKNEIENKFVENHILLSKIAKRKYDQYKKLGFEEFRLAAISFAAAAAAEKPTAKYFYQLGTFYDGKSTVLALNNFITAKTIDKSFFDDEKSQRFKELEIEAVEQISSAIDENNQDYLKSFLSLDLDRVISINGKSLLNYAIEKDQPDAVQLILNKYVSNKNKEDLNSKIQKTIMLCAANNSNKTITRFIELGVSTDFSINNNTPVDIAHNTMSSEALYLLIHNSNSKEKYIKDYKNQASYFLYESETNPKAVGEKIDQLPNEEIKNTTNYLLDNLLTKEQYFKVLSHSVKAKDLLKTNIILSNKANSQFFNELKRKNDIESQADKYITNEIITFSSIPTLDQLEKKYLKDKTSYEKPLTLSQEFDVIIKQLDGLKEIVIGMQGGKTSYVTENYDKYIDRYILMKENASLLTQNEKWKIESDVLATLLNDAKNQFPSLRMDYYYYYKNKYSAEPKVEFLDKVIYLQKAFTDIKPDNQDMVYENAQLLAKKYNHLKTKDNPSKADVKDVLLGYPMMRLYNGLSIDMESINFLKFGGDSGAKRVQGSDNLAIVAYKRGLVTLFKALDSKHDLNDAYNSENESVFECLLKSIDIDDLGITNKNSHAKSFKFISEDFDFNKPINGIHPLVIFSNRNLSGGFAGAYLSKFYQAFKIDNPNMVIDNNGNTIWHWYINEMVKKDKGPVAYYSCFYDGVKSIIDKTKKNNDGLTPYTLYMKNRKEILSQLATESPQAKPKWFEKKFFEVIK